MSGHTPGPWRVETDIRNDHGRESEMVGWNIVSDAHEIVGCEGIEAWFENGEANAKLIAAAPAMLAVLYELESYFEDREDVVDGDYGQPEPNKEMTLLREVRDAIQKATGESA